MASVLKKAIGNPPKPLPGEVAEKPGLGFLAVPRSRLSSPQTFSCPRTLDRFLPGPLLETSLRVLWTDLSPLLMGELQNPLFSWGKTVRRVGKFVAPMRADLAWGGLTGDPEGAASDSDVQEGIWSRDPLSVRRRRPGALEETRVTSRLRRFCGFRSRP